MTDPFEPAARPMFTLYMRDGREINIAADSISSPSGACPFYILEIQGDPIAEFYRDAVVGWSVQRH